MSSPFCVSLPLCILASVYVSSLLASSSFPLSACPRLHVSVCVSSFHVSSWLCVLCPVFHQQIHLHHSQSQGRSPPLPLPLNYFPCISLRCLNFSSWPHQSWSARGHDECVQAPHTDLGALLLAPRLSFLLLLLTRLPETWPDLITTEARTAGEGRAARRLQRVASWQGKRVREELW